MSSITILLFTILILLFIIHRLKRIETMIFNIDLKLKPKSPYTVYHKHYENRGMCRRRYKNQCRDARRACRRCKTTRYGKGGRRRTHCWISSRCIRRRTTNQSGCSNINGRHGWKISKRNIRSFCRHKRNRNYTTSTELKDSDAPTNSLDKFTLYDSKNNQLYQGDFTNKTCNNLNDYTTYRFENIDIPVDTTIKSYNISVGNDNFKLRDHEIDFRNETGNYMHEEKNKGGGIIGEQYEYKVNKQKMTWDEHENEAKKWGGHLASITSEDEHNHLKRLCNGLDTRGWTGPYIGGIRISSSSGTGPNNWKWIDGTTWNFENWGSREPNNNREQVAQMAGEKGFKWNDITKTRRCSGIYKKRGVEKNSKTWDLKEGGLYIYPDGNGIGNETSVNNN